MDRAEFQAIEGYMLQQMADMAHDAQHVYRVFYTALDITGRETEADRDIVAAAALLHDVGRAAQARDPALCHAQVGSEMAYRFLTRELGWDEGRAGHVRACVLTHRFRSDRPPESLEAKIVFDADKLDVTGAIGVARTLMYGGQVGQGLYRLDQDGKVLTGAETAPSFFREYNFKLRGIAGGAVYPAGPGAGPGAAEGCRRFLRRLAGGSHGEPGAGTVGAGWLAERNGGFLTWLCRSMTRCMRTTCGCWRTGGSGPTRRSGP